MQKEPYVFYMDRLEIPHLRVDGTAQIQRFEEGEPGYPHLGLNMGEPLWRITVLAGEVGFEGNYIQDCGDYWEVSYYGGLGLADYLRYSLGGHPAKHGSIDLDWGQLQERLGNREAA
jgi:hypothetical protein